MGTDRWETGEEQVVGRTTWRTEYQQRCYNVPKQVCSTTPCGSQGCGPGNDVCSATDYTWNERCARPSGAQTPCGSCGSTGTCEDSCSEPRRTAQGSVCQRVKEASCYGNLASCETPGQKCCRTTYERVCQQVPTRVPVMVNMTIPGRPIRKQDCQMVERTIPRYKTEMQTRNETRTRQVCEPKMEERCVNFTLPSFEKVNVDMKEKVELGSIQADIRESNRTKCLNIPRAKVTCMSSKVNKRFVVNKVVCDQRRKTNVCRSIPWSQCTPGSGQECRMMRPASPVRPTRPGLSIRWRWWSRRKRPRRSCGWNLRKVFRSRFRLSVAWCKSSRPRLPTTYLSFPSFKHSATAHGKYA